VSICAYDGIACRAWQADTVDIGGAIERFYDAPELGWEIATREETGQGLLRPVRYGHDNIKSVADVFCEFEYFP